MGSEHKLCEFQKKAAIGCGALAAFLLLIMLVFAGLIGDDYACRYKVYPVPKTMIHFSQIASNNTGAVTENFGTSQSPVWGYMKTLYTSPSNGKEMQAGYINLPASKSIGYVQRYEGFVLVTKGQFIIRDNAGGSGNTLTGVEGDSFYIPRGTTVTLTATVNSVLYYVNQPAGFQFSQQIGKAIANRPAIQKKENYKNLKDKIPKYENKDKSDSYLKDTLFSTLSNRNITGGYYLIKKSPALKYTYTYDEFKYIVEGEFTLKDGTGKEVTAKGGDLMYFPKGVYVEFTTPKEGLGFFVGQRAKDGA